MLDMNALADSRAQTLSQKPDEWRQAIWSAGFQALTQSMTDGEVELFLRNCLEPKQLIKAVAHLQPRCLVGLKTPFEVIAEETAQSSIEDWFAKLRLES